MQCAKLTNATVPVWPAALVEVKRPKNDGAIVASGPLRTSSLKAPIMLLTGHGVNIKPH